MFEIVVVNREINNTPGITNLILGKTKLPVEAIGISDEEVVPGLFPINYMLLGFEVLNF